ncbi:hypothetical protein AB9Q10_16315 [Streptomyces krungchingensis]|uniref:hypothetical protein n=1 Tax=Streptomyces krungchingensis TaxID=1565034 RepID=UPI003CFA1324
MTQPTPDARAVVRAFEGMTTQVRRIADALTTTVAQAVVDASSAQQADYALAPTPTDDGPAPAADETAPNMLRVLTDRAARGVLVGTEGEALRRRVEQFIAGRAHWKAKAEEIEQDRDRLAAELARIRRALDPDDETYIRETVDDQLALERRAQKAERAADLLAGAHQRAERLETAARAVLEICGEQGSDVQDILRPALDGIEQPTAQA